MTWDDRWWAQAELAASWSKDKHRKVGAAIVDRRQVLLAIGWNGLARGVDDNVAARYERPEKYRWMVHAERNAIANAAAKGIATAGARLYVQCFPCSVCAGDIIQAGIREVITVEPDWRHPRHSEDWRAAMLMFDEAKVLLSFRSGRK